jgi:hypothetical protein
MSDEVETKEAPSGEPAPKPKTYTEADLAGLKANNERLREETRAAKERAAVLGDRALDEVKADLELARATREAKAKAEGDFTSLKAQLLEQHNAEITKRDTRVKHVERKLYDVLAKREAEAAIVAAGGNPRLLLPHVLPAVQVVEDGEDFVARVVDAKGQPRIADGQGTAMTISQLVESFKADETFGLAFAPPDAAGSGSRNQPGPGGGAGTVLIPKDAAPQEYRRLKAEAEKAGRPYAVAQ